MFELRNPKIDDSPHFRCLKCGAIPNLTEIITTYAGGKDNPDNREYELECCGNTARALAKRSGEDKEWEVEFK